MKQIDVMKQALEALDIAQSLLEKSRHHQTVFDAYINLRGCINKTEPVKSFDEVFDVIDWDVWRSQPIRELVRMIHSKTAQREPLTEDEVAKALAVAKLRPENYREDGEIMPLVRAVEAAHGITKGCVL